MTTRESSWHELQSLSLIHEAITGGLDEQAVMQLIADEACRLTSADRVAVFLVDGDQLRIVATAGEASASDSTSTDIPLAGSLVEETIVSGRPSRVANALDDPHVLVDESRRSLVESLDIHSLLIAPLMVAGRAIGAISLSDRAADHFDEADEQLSMLMAYQAALAVENARLRRQVQQTAVREERGRLARELHDSVTQSLYSLTLFAEAARSIAERDGNAQLEERVERIGDIAQQALKEMRLLVFELRPSVLDDGGLIGALRQRLEAVEGRAGVDAQLVVAELVSLPAGVEQELYRIAQEALNNALKHAAASSVKVTLGCDPGVVWLEIVDDGIGFDAEEAESSGGMGLANMRQRAEQVGGEASIEATPGSGTRVRVSVPVKTESAEE